MDEAPTTNPDDAKAMALFVAAMVADPALQARIAPITHPDRFAEAVLALAASMGIALSVAAVANAARPDPLGLGRFGSAPVTLDHMPMRHWLPTRSVRGADMAASDPAFDWAWFGTETLNDSFHEDSVRRAGTLPFNRMFRTRTTLDTLIRAAPGQATIPPTGFIFHMSRCGSTLAARMLGAVPRHVVVSEPEPLDAVVQWAMLSGAPLADRVAALRAAVAAFGRDRSGIAQRFFVKLDSWHTRALPLFRAAFPDTPWLFLHRDPVEVMASQMRMRGLQTVPGVLPPEILGIAHGETMPAEEYCALALASVCAAVCEHWHLGGGMLVAYADLAETMRMRIPRHFGFVPDAEEAAAMTREAAHDAKDPARMFVADGTAKRAAASSAIHSAAARHLTPTIARLTRLR